MKNAFVKSIVFVIFIFAFLLACKAQEACELKGKSAPLFHGLKLEMSPDEVQRVFGQNLKIKIKKKGERGFFQNFIEKSAPESLRGVRALYLRFFDGKLYQIEIFYQETENLKTLEAITKKLSADFDFPVSEWKFKPKRARADCVEASLVADKILNPRVELTDETTRARVEELRQKESKKK